LRADAWAELMRSADPDGRGLRPSIKSHGSYVLGLLLAAVAVPEEDVVYYQEVDFVLSRERIVTVRKTPGERQPFDPSHIGDVCDAVEHEHSPGMIAYFLVDDVAERYIDLLDAVDEEIDELEEGVDTWSAEKTRKRISELRHDLLHIRKTLAPTRDAVREVVDGRVDIEGRTLFTREVFPREVEQQFATTYDKLLRATEGVEYARDLLSAARDYQQARVSIDQNEVVKRLTAIASILLVPTFIVGLYGQNFVHTPEYHWHYGYAWSWFLILTTTIAQVVYFRRKGWL
jgi:magnesium transporter